MPDDEERETPPTVVGAIAAGVAPAPFLVTYSVLFILHGTVFPADPPDITGSHGGETLAGVIALVFLVLIVLGLGWLLSRRTRWLFLAGQLTVLGLSIDFLFDPTSGAGTVPLVLALTSAASITLGCVPPSWRWVSSDSARHASSGGGVEPPEAEPDPGLDLWTPDVGGGPVDPNPAGWRGAAGPQST
jgi:hypothetical protein